MSFIQSRTGVSEEECHHMAIRFLFAMFPEADQYFRVQYDEGENAGLTYKACSGGVDLRFGEGRICVSKKTGLVTFYMPPEIDPKELQEIDPVPSLTMEEAKDAIRRAIKAELAWDRFYDDGGMFAEKCTDSYTSRFSRGLLRHLWGSDHEFNRLKVIGVRFGGFK